MTASRKTEPPLKLDTDLGEALERFARVKPKEVAVSIERSKAKKSRRGVCLGGRHHRAADASLAMIGAKSL